jgi:hypothetical protein
MRPSYLHFFILNFILDQTHLTHTLSCLLLGIHVEFWLIMLWP